LHQHPYPLRFSKHPRNTTPHNTEIWDHPWIFVTPGGVVKIQDNMQKMQCSIRVSYQMVVITATQHSFCISVWCKNLSAGWFLCCSKCWLFCISRTRNNSKCAWIMHKKTCKGEAL
jgi:hypothetical protein